MRTPLGFDPAWIVHHDEHFVVVDKPAGMLSIEREVGGEGSLVSRLTKHLSLAKPLAVHSRLDQDTSGLIAFPLTVEANAAMARATEQHTLAKRYVACVLTMGLGDDRLDGRMEDWLVERDGRVAITDEGAGKRAVAHARELVRRDGRVLVEVVLETGRTHQIRVQLAARTLGMAGERLYTRRGHVGAPRLLLASVGITLPHPTLGPLTLTRPVPDLFTRWIEDRLTPEGAWRAALPVAIERRADFFAHARRSAEEATTAFRLFSDAGDGVHGVAVDVYGEHLLVHLSDCGVPEPVILDSLAALEPRGIYVKRRPKKAQELSKADMELHAPSAPLRGEPAEPEMIVREHGIAFPVRLGDGMSTGIFLDQRENRRRVRELAAGKSFLNLFSYTCAFTVAAALGGAKSTLSVDAARRAIDRGRAHPALADESKHRFIVDDVFDVLARLAKRSDRFDLIIVDPPTFSTVGKSRWTSLDAWEGLLRSVLAISSEHGVVIATSNDGRMSQLDFREIALKVMRGGRRLVDLAEPLDFRVGAGARGLKGLMIAPG